MGGLHHGFKNLAGNRAAREIGKHTMIGTMIGLVFATAYQKTISDPCTRAIKEFYEKYDAGLIESPYEKSYREKFGN